MKMSSVRSGALLVGAATLCAIPAVAIAQVDPGKAVDGIKQQVPQVTPQVQVPKPPKVEVPQLPSTGSKGSAPRSSAPGDGGGGAAQPGDRPSSGTASGTSGATGGYSGAGASKEAPGGGEKMGAASKKRAAGGDDGEVAGQRQAANPGQAEAAGADVGDTVRPATGTSGDPKLPFTGYTLALVAGLGLLALATGAGMHAAGRLRLRGRAS